jgi:hypothetical protein
MDTCLNFTTERKTGHERWRQFESIARRRRGGERKISEAISKTLMAR